MPPDYSHTEIKDVDGKLKEIVFMPSTIETIDQAVYKYIDESLDLRSNTNKGWKKIPVIWVAHERSHQIKNNRGLRDSQGVLKLPLITIERSSMVKDPAFRGTFQAHMPDTARGYHSVRRVNVPAGRRINQGKTSNFKNAWSSRQYGNINNTTVGHGQQNFPGIATDKSRVVFETIYQPIPIWVKTMYSLKIRTQFIQQMNELTQPFYVRTGQASSFFTTHEGHRYEAFVEGDFGQTNNVAELGEEERIYQTEINLKVLGYLMGEGPNDDRPKITVVENFVDIKIPRERVILGDINTFLDEIEEGKGFYRE
tara:strand:+ start:3876 stop:4808 length:933 start_codon:yes stop_codon:yes gene_type:complete